MWFSAGFVSITGSCSACSSTGNEWNANVQSVCCCKSKRICLPRGELISGAPERGLPEPVEPKTTVVSSNNRTTHNCVNCQKAGLRGSLNSNEWISTQIFQPIVRVSIVFPKAASFKSLVWTLCALNVVCSECEWSQAEGPLQTNSGSLITNANNTLLVKCWAGFWHLCIAACCVQMC